MFNIRSNGSTTYIRSAGEPLEMGFGGGGGSTGVSNHVHSNAVGEGGSLSTTETLISNSNLYTSIIVGA